MADYGFDQWLWSQGMTKSQFHDEVEKETKAAPPRPDLKEPRSDDGDWETVWHALHEPYDARGDGGIDRFTVARAKAALFRLQRRHDREEEQ
jgi:hypothetical protein